MTKRQPLMIILSINATPEQLGDAPQCFVLTSEKNNPSTRNQLNRLAVREEYRLWNHCDDNCVVTTTCTDADFGYQVKTRVALIRLTHQA